MHSCTLQLWEGGGAAERGGIITRSRKGCLVKKAPHDNHRRTTFYRGAAKTSILGVGKMARIQTDHRHLNGSVPFHGDTKSAIVYALFCRYRLRKPLLCYWLYLRLPAPYKGARTENILRQRHRTARVASRIHEARWRQKYSLRRRLQWGSLSTGVRLFVGSRLHKK